MRRILRFAPSVLILVAPPVIAQQPAHPHYAWAGGQDTVVQVHGEGPTDITFVNPADDPRKK
jgi:hypothetical protein